MKRNLILLVILILVSISLYFSIQKKGNSSSTNDRNFAIKSIDDVGEILLGDYKGHRTSIKRINGEWMVNDTYPVNKRRFAVLERTLTDIEIKYIPTALESKTAIKQISSYPIQAKIFDRQGQEIRSYIIGGTNANGSGTYMIMDGSDQIYVMHLSYMYGAVDLRYHPDTEYWIAKEPFAHLDLTHFDQIDLRFAGDKRNNMKVNLKNYMIEPQFPIEGIQNANLNKSKVEGMIEDIFSLQSSRILSQTEDEAYYASNEPAFDIILSSRDSSVNAYHLKGYLEVKRDQKGNIIQGQEELYSVRQKTDFYLLKAPNGFYYSVASSRLNNCFRSIEYLYDIETKTEE